MQLLRQTAALCLECDAYHDADVVSRENRILGVLHCPKGDQEYLISSNAPMYMDLSRRSFIGPSDEPQRGLRPILNYLSITNACNFHCAVCAASSGGQKNTFLSVDEIIRRAEEIGKSGSKTVRLFGGEPTIHPEIRVIIKRLARMGFRVWMVSNGYLLGQNGDIARELKNCGLRGVCIQFDSLQKATLDFLCRSYLNEKRKAIDHIVHAGLYLGFNCTVTRKNLPELNSLLKNHLSSGSTVRNLVFGSAAPVGRFEIAEEESVDREEIISSFIGERGAYFEFEDVFPLPSYSPWGVQIHPDCGAHVILAKTSKSVKPLNFFVDMQHLYSLMAKSGFASNYFSAKVLPVLYVLISLRKKRLWACLKLIGALLLNPRNNYLFNVAFVDYRGKRFLDRQRIRRCTAAFYTSVGPVSGCLHFYQGADKPGSIAYESAHESC